MGLLSRREPSREAVEAVVRLEKRLQALEERWLEIDVQWSEWYDKYRRLYARLAKRVSDERKKEQPEKSDSSNSSQPYVRIRNPLAAQLIRGYGPVQRSSASAATSGSTDCEDCD